MYLGYDKPRNIGRLATGGHLAAPVVRDFLKIALADKPPIPFTVPPGIKLIRVDAHTGMRAGPGDPKTILEAFKPGTAPPDSYSVIGADTDQRRSGVAAAPCPTPAMSSAPALAAFIDRYCMTSMPRAKRCSARDSLQRAA